MSNNVIEEYFVALKFQSDNHGFREFDSLLNRAESSVERHTGGMVKTILKTQAGILGGFVSVAGSVVGMADNVANADQRYRLLGRTMGMTTDAARQMDIVSKTLGASWSEILWDPELTARALPMLHNMETMKKAMPEFEQNMVRIRDLTTKVSELWHVHGEFLQMSVVSEVLKGFGLNVDIAQEKLDHWVKYATEHMPEISQSVATQLVPILKETWGMLGQMGDATKDFGLIFTNTVADISGDSSIHATELHFDNLAKAIGHVVEGIGAIGSAIGTNEGILMDFVGATSATFANLKVKTTELIDYLQKTQHDRIEELKNTPQYKKAAGFVQEAGHSTLTEAQLAGWRWLQPKLGPAWDMFKDTTSKPFKGAWGLVPEPWQQKLLDDRGKVGPLQGAVAGVAAGGALGAPLFGIGALPGALLGGLLGAGAGFLNAGGTVADEMSIPWNPKKNYPDSLQLGTDYILNGDAGAADPLNLGPAASRVPITPLGALMAQFEGFNTKAAPSITQGNNPGGIEYGKFAISQGATGKAPNGTAIWSTLEAGIAAQTKLLLMSTKDQTPLSFVNKYEGVDPITGKQAKGNTPEATAAYAASIARGLGIGVNDQIPQWALSMKGEMGQQYLNRPIQLDNGGAPNPPAKVEFNQSISITNPALSKEEIQGLVSNATRDGIREAMSSETQWGQVQLTPAYH